MAINLMKKIYIKVNKKIIINCCLIVIFLAFNQVYARVSNRPKACASNIRVIQGAVEMYNMDAATMMRTLDMDKLIKGNYLKERPSHPESSCEYSNVGNLDGKGFVICKYHGDVDQIIECEFYKDDEFHQYRKIPQNATEEDLKKANIPEIIKERDRFREKRDIILKEKAEKKAKQKLIELYVPLIAVVLTLIVGVIIDISNYIKNR